MEERGKKKGASFAVFLTFQYFSLQRDETALKKLADYVIDRNYPLIKKVKNPYLKLLEEVMDRHAKLVTQWMQVGFIHGVMNTDNMAISGETIDYGPCAFLDTFDQTVNLEFFVVLKK